MILVKIILFLWQLPQDLIGFLIAKIERAAKRTDFKTAYYATSFPGPFMKRCAVSLGDFIIIDSFVATEQNVRHERGHQIQSRILGPLYLLVIGLPSLIGNLMDRTAHKKWSSQKREQWYYSLPWEHWADSLGNVTR